MREPYCPMCKEPFLLSGGDLIIYNCLNTSKHNGLNLAVYINSPIDYAILFPIDDHLALDCYTHTHNTNMTLAVRPRDRNLYTNLTTIPIIPLSMDKSINDALDELIARVKVMIAYE